jgi:hypothetical protein
MCLATAVSLAPLLLAASTSDAGDVDWYPAECRRSSRCAQVDDASYARVGSGVGETLLTVTTKHGTALVPHALPVRPSADQAMHACMRVEREGMELTCLFLPRREGASSRAGDWWTAARVARE